MYLRTFQLIGAGVRLAVVAALALAVQTASAEIVYVDATLANTDNAAGGADSTWVDGDDGSTGGTVTDGTGGSTVPADGLWRFRSTFGNGGIFEATSSGSQPEDDPELVTTATGLADGLYNAYVFYFPVGSGNTEGLPDYPIRAGFTSNPNGNQLYDSQGEDLGSIAGVDASTLTYDAGFAPPTGDETRPLLAALIGQTTVTGGSLSVFIDDLPVLGNSTSASQRTWYAGIGYQLVPEPSSIALGALFAGMGLVGVLRKRWG